MAEAEDKFADFPIVNAGSKQTADEDKFADFPIVGATPGDKAKAFAAGASGGFVETGAGILGTIGGVLAGAPGGPVGSAALGALGYGLGTQIGKKLRSGSVEQMDPELRPYGYAGEVVGGGAPIAAAPVAAGSVGLRVAQNSGFGGFINRMLDMAKDAPKRFLAAETGGLAGSAVGSGVAEEALPGQTGPRVGAEIAGGFLNPSRLVLSTYGTAVDASKRILAAVSKAGVENRAAATLQKILTESGEDPAKVAASLRASGLPGVNMTSAQKSGSQALTALEEKLSADSAKFGAERQKVGDDAMSAIKDMMVSLRASGDPNALRAAAEIREKYFKSLIAGRLQMAERDATEAAGKISTESPGARAAISRQADDLLQGALRDVRSAERDLWEKIPRDVTGSAENLTATYTKLKNELLPNETLPSVIEGFVKQLTKEGEQAAILGADGKPIRQFMVGSNTGETTSGNLLRFRSRALELARDAAANGNSGDARRYGLLAEAALDDLSALPATTRGLDDARNFSRELHDTFTRTFAGDATATARGGRDRIPPELTMRFALGGGGEQGALQLRQIEQAMKFLPERALGGTENLNTMIDLQNRFLRIAASDSVDPLTGKVSPQKIANFMRTNEEILNRFPDVKNDLTKALSSQTALQDIQRTLTGATKTIEQKAAFSKFAGMENAADVVRGAVQGQNPVSDLKKLATMAKGGGTQAVEGLRATVWDDAIRRASDRGGNISVQRLYDNMFKPVGPNQPSLINIMHDQGIINRTDMAKAETLFKEFSKVEEALGKGSGIDKIGTVDPLYDFAARMVGVHAASLVAPKGPGAIVAAGRASQLARNLFEKVPMAKMQDVLQQAAMDPKFGAMLLEKPASPKAAIRLATQIHAYMFQAGLTALDGDQQ